MEHDGLGALGAFQHIDHFLLPFTVSLGFADDMAELLLGESKLEQHLREKPLRQGASPRGPRPQLTEVRKHLTAALDRGNLKVLQDLWDQEGKGRVLLSLPGDSVGLRKTPGEQGVFGVRVTALGLSSAAGALHACSVQLP